MAKAITVYLIDPVTTEIKYTFLSMQKAADALGISRQAVQASIKLNHLSRGYQIVPVEAYEQIEAK